LKEKLFDCELPSALSITLTLEKGCDRTFADTAGLDAGIAPGED